MQLQPGEFLGNLLCARDSGGFVLTEYTYAAGTKLRRHDHPLAYLSFPLRGSYEEHCGNMPVRCTAGAGVFHPRGEVHEDRFGEEGARIFSVEIADSWLERLREEGVSIHARNHLASRPVLRAAMRLRQLAASRAPSRLKIEAAATELLASLPAPVARTRAPRWLDDAAEYLRACMPRRPTSAELARVAGVHPVHVARVFRTVYGCTIDEYVRGLRVDYARHLLRRGGALDDVALAAGFADQSHFCREFKRVTAMTPREFRSRTLHCFKSVAPVQDAGSSGS